MSSPHHKHADRNIIILFYFFFVHYARFNSQIYEKEIAKRGNTHNAVKIKLHMFQLWSSVFAKSVLVMIKLRSAMFRVSNMQPQLLLFSITNVSISLSNLHLDHQGGHIPPCDASFCPPIFLSFFPYREKGRIHAPLDLVLLDMNSFQVRNNRNNKEYNKKSGFISGQKLIATK